MWQKTEKKLKGNFEIGEGNKKIEMMDLWQTKKKKVLQKKNWCTDYLLLPLLRMADSEYLTYTTLTQILTNRHLGHKLDTDLQSRR